MENSEGQSTIVVAGGMNTAYALTGLLKIVFFN
jgi:hypothetical protein